MNELCGYVGAIRYWCCYVCPTYMEIRNHSTLKPNILSSQLGNIGNLFIFNRVRGLGSNHSSCSSELTLLVLVVSETWLRPSILTCTSVSRMKEK